MELIKADAKKYGIEFETQNLETYGVTIKNIDQVEREIKAKKKLEQSSLREKNVAGNIMKIARRYSNK